MSYDMLFKEPEALDNCRWIASAQSFLHGQAVHVEDIGDALFFLNKGGNKGSLMVFCMDKIESGNL